jgi:hypothetical protein
MIYFFARAGQFTRCEIHPGRPHRMIVCSPDGLEQIEQHSSSAELHTRWEDLCDRLEADGWSGPFGRDPRV